MKSKTSNLCRIASILFIFLLAVGCTIEPKKITRENYQKLKFGMSYEEVTAILGEPLTFSTIAGIKQYTWVEGERHIHTKLVANRAIYYSSKNLGSKESTDRTGSGH